MSTNGTHGTPQPFAAVSETVDWDGPILAGPEKKRRTRKAKRWWMVYLGKEPIWTVDAPTEKEALARAQEVTSRPVTVREMGK